MCPDMRIWPFWQFLTKNRISTKKIIFSTLKHSKIHIFNFQTLLINVSRDKKGHFLAIVVRPPSLQIKKLVKSQSGHAA